MVVFMAPLNLPKGEKQLPLCINSLLWRRRDGDEVGGYGKVASNFLSNFISLEV